MMEDSEVYLYVKEGDREVRKLIKKVTKEEMINWVKMNCPSIDALKFKLDTTDNKLAIFNWAMKIRSSLRLSIT